MKHASTYTNTQAYFCNHCLSMARQPFVAPWTLLQFHYLFYTDGSAPWTGDQPVARPLPTHRTSWTQNKRIHTPNIHAFSGIRTHNPSVRAREDSSYLWPRGHRDRRIFIIRSLIPAKPILSLKTWELFWINVLKRNFKYRGLCNSHIRLFNSIIFRT
jgi:hypothetical protein